MIVKGIRFAAAKPPLTTNSRRANIATTAHQQTPRFSRVSNDTSILSSTAISFNSQYGIMDMNLTEKVLFGMLLGLALLVGSELEAAEYEGYQFELDTIATYLQDEHEEAAAEGNTAALDVYIGGWSVHIGQDDYESNHNFLGFAYDNILMASFKNSYGAQSYLVSYYYSKEFWEVWEGGIHLGLVTGYEPDQLEYTVCTGDSNPTCFMPALQVAYTKWMVQPVLALYGNAVVFSFRIDFGG